MTASEWPESICFFFAKGQTCAGLPAPPRGRRAFRCGGLVSPERILQLGGFMPEGKAGEPDSKQLRSLAKGLIDEQSTVTLATCGKDGAWAAPVYYVFLKSAFYFFSGPRFPSYRGSPGKWSGFGRDPRVRNGLAGDTGHPDDGTYRGPFPRDWNRPGSSQSISRSSNLQKRSFHPGPPWIWMPLHRGSGQALQIHPHPRLLSGQPYSIRFQGTGNALGNGFRTLKKPLRP